MTVIVAGGGIAGMTMALTCHQLELPVIVHESVKTIEPLGVGINLQPNAVRELFELGLERDLAEIGIQAKEWALVGKNGNDVWSEPRGLDAGYRWPQYSVHRGHLQMMLYRQVLKRLGPKAVISDSRLKSYNNDNDHVLAHFVDSDGKEQKVEGSILVGADGLHSSVRAQMHPNDGPPKWGGAVMWRGTTQAKPIRTGASFVLLGKLEQRFVCYPISQPDPITGKAIINWIAELTYDTSKEWGHSDWNTQVPVEKFINHFSDWSYEWLDVPQLIREASAVYEYPMVDRDPLTTWVDGRCVLVGDAAHVMYPVGSNGASQAIVDTRVLGSAFVKHGLDQTALLHYESLNLKEMNELVLRNRGAGPIGILGIVEERCGGVFDKIEDVIPRSEIEQYMSNYKAAAGFAIETLNNAPPTIST
ncbi:MAG TPA: flavin-dependent oxidoreductase [Acidimicrobiaceae bacterium]|jgi:2-polyprenyl-6-methoxyphenol hydroxylase-like FAD-dependent oxidoreductase|nr:flavin-dependent oxidoreductase [Acidimicrobiaceae bacterium]HAA67130.1 flavin-dependent oxidoreductase [Acidimicrobiaceae bacterium]HAY66436.1 flavin-dependent oxidoreductase [Acidimicrobiaceae bacterium]|tara:strand:+ start:2862 stop:4115 length:1254 start_codon:yes stop_codon:yes gene_type:complete